MTPETAESEHANSKIKQMCEVQTGTQEKTSSSHYRDAAGSYKSTES